MDYRGAQTTAVISTFACLGTFILFLRLWTRLFLIRAPGWEDLVIFLSWLNAVATVICSGIQIYYGLGKDVKTLSSYQMEQMTLCLYISISTYGASLGLTKLAILMQYRRAFPIPRFQILNSILIAIIAAYTISAVLAVIFMCWPVQKFWKPSIEGQCINTFAAWLANAILNIVTDLMIIGLPIPVIKSLQFPKRQKVLLMAVFACGVVVCVISISRLHSIVVLTHSTNPSYDGSLAATFSVVEIYVGIICACLPPLRPLLSKWFSSLDFKRQPSPDLRQKATIGSAGKKPLGISEIMYTQDDKDTKRSSIFLRRGSESQQMLVGGEGVEMMGAAFDEDKGAASCSAKENHSEERKRSKEGTVNFDIRINITVDGENVTVRGSELTGATASTDQRGKGGMENTEHIV